MNSTFSSRLKELRAKKVLSQKDLGSLIGLSDKTISAYENGRNAPDFEILKKLSRVFGVSVDYMLGASIESETTAQEYPLETIPIFEKTSFKNPFDYLKLPTWAGCNYGILVTDDSTEPTLSKGDIALIRKGPAIEGDLVVWKTDEQIDIFRLYFQDDMIILKPENSKYRPVILNSTEIVRSLNGVVIGRWQKFK
jgi:repressor LexA